MVPGDVGARCVAARMATVERDTGYAGPWLVDGFPRRAAHVAAWRPHVVDAVLLLRLVCPVDASLARAARTGRPEDRDPDVARKRVELWHREERELLQELRRHMPGRVVTVRTDRRMDIVETELEEVVTVSIPGSSDHISLGSETVELS
jgi:adenylate kinase family enzyme